MKKFTIIKDMQEHARSLIRMGKKIGFVPTMGYLHDGHLSLMRKSKSENDITIASIFVNPMQFGANEDLDKYPRDLEKDERLMTELGVDILFNPEAAEVYKEPYLTSVDVEKITSLAEGASRPGHFKGVTTVVNKLLNIVQPDVLYLGQKDIQQAVIIGKMITDLNIGVELNICPTVRESDGLAMSSRNVYLSDEDRRNSLGLSTSLKAAEAEFQSGNIDAESVLQKMVENLEKYPGAKLDYIIFVDQESFSPVKRITQGTVVAICCIVGKTRLIDNVILT